MRKSRGMRGMGACAVLAAVLFLAVPVQAFGAEAGWEQKEGSWRYCLGDDENGEAVYLKDGVTPDGYYVNGDGIWYQRKNRIMDRDYTAYDTFPPPDMDWTETENTRNIRESVANTFRGSRRVRVTDTELEYQKRAERKGETDTVMLGVYKDASADGYRLELKILLDPENLDVSSADYYNYQIFKALLFQVSATPELLENAVYRAWQGDNGWNISRESWTRVGDCQVKYVSGNGFGRFLIARAGYGEQGF